MIGGNVVKWFFLRDLDLCFVTQRSLECSKMKKKKIYDYKIHTYSWGIKDFNKLKTPLYGVTLL